MLAHFPLVLPMVRTNSGHATIEDSEMPSLGKTVRAWVFFSAAAPLGSRRNSRTRLNPESKRSTEMHTRKCNKCNGRSVQLSLIQVFKVWRKYPLQTLGRQSTFQWPWQRDVTELAALAIGTRCKWSQILTPSSLASKPYLLRWWEEPHWKTWKKSENFAFCEIWKWRNGGEKKRKL